MTMTERLAAEARDAMDPLRPIQRHLVDLWSVDRAMPPFRRFADSAGDSDVLTDMWKIVEAAWTLPDSASPTNAGEEVMDRLQVICQRIDDAAGEFGGTSQQICLQLDAAIEAFLAGTLDAAEQSVVAALDTQFMRGEESILYPDPPAEGPKILIQRPGEVEVRPVSRQFMEDEMKWRAIATPKAAKFTQIAGPTRLSRPEISSSGTE
ncbi:MAG TPA: hypothetical protein VGN14_10040 [Candidatus Elarobacter sp.]